MNNFFKALEVFLETTEGDAGTLKQITKGRVLTILGDDPEAAKASDDFQEAQVMKTKGMGIVVYGAAGSNNSVDSTDKKIDATVNFSVLLLLHPLWGGPAYGERKWKQLEVLQDLTTTLNGAQVGRVPNNCHHTIRVSDWAPEDISGLNAWTILCRRKLKL